MSEATLYNWKAKYGGLDVSEAKRLKALEDKNAKLKRLLADAMLDAAALKSFSEKMVGPPLALHRASHAEPQPAPPAAKRAAVAHLKPVFEMSERRAEQIEGSVVRSTME